MKVFAILIAAVMTTAGAGYYLCTDCSTCPNSGCPVAKTGGCCTNNGGEKVQSCEVPCGGCEKDCRECCDICEQCCTSAVQVPTEETPASLATGAVTAGVTLK